jgi:hypothetical protein
MTSDELYEILSLSQQDKEELTEYNGLSKEEEEYRIKDWCTLFRRNPDIFFRDFLDINLCPFQEQIMFNSDDNDISVDVMSRGIGKSYTTAGTCVRYALLYPSCDILLTSMTLSQSNNIIDEKIDKIFCTEGTAFSSPILCQLRKDGWIKFKTDPNTSARYVEFGNGSKIFAVNCGESARGRRSNIVVVDEFMLIKKKDYDEIISPTLEPRHFAGRPTKGYSEEPKQIFLSSARNKTNWGWKHLVNAVNNHYKGGHTKYGFYAGDIFTAVANGIQTKKQYLQRKKDTDDMSFQQEYLNIFLGNNEDSIFKYEDFEQNQVIHKAFTPLTRDDVLDGKQQKWKFGDDDEEIRWLTTDIAVATGDDNDNTVIILSKLNVNTKQKSEEYITTFNGMNSVEQVLTMKRLFYDYKCNYFVIDSRGVGATLWDLFTVETFDPMLNVTYPAWTVNTDGLLQISSDTVIKDKIERAMSNNAKDVMIPFVGTAELNSNGHLALRKALKDRSIDLLIDDHDKRAELENNDVNYFTRDAEEKAKELLPYLQTRFMINEAVALEVKFTESGNIKLSEAKRTATKDRYMTLMMANYFGDKLINKYCSDDSLEDFDIEDFQLVF